jgi:hypothetical protein
MDPDPSIFIIDLQDDKKFSFLSFSAYYFSKIKVKKKSQNSRNQGFLLLFLLNDGMICGYGGPGLGSRSATLVKRKFVLPIFRKSSPVWTTIFLLF